MKEFLKNKVQVIIASVFAVIILTLSIVGGITISNLNNQINNLNNQIENMNKVDEDLDSYIDNLETELNTIKTNLNNTNTKINELEVAFGSDLDEAEENILNELNNVKTSLETELEEISTLIEELTNKDSALEGRITSLETSVDNLNTTLEALIIQVNQNAEDIKALEDIMAGLETGINDLKTKLEELETKLNSTNTKINELEVAFGTDLDEVEESILNELNNVKTSLETELEEISTLIEELTNKDSALEGRITSLETSVNNLNATLEALIIQVNQNAEDIRALEDIIAGLEIRVNCLEGNHVASENTVYTWSEDYNEVTADGYCVHCEEELHETVTTTYLDGFVSADFLSEYFEDQLLITVSSSQELLNAIDNAEIIAITEKTATIKLMKDIEVEVEADEYGGFEDAILIETGNIIIDLNGYTLSATNDPDFIIQIGAEWGELCEAVVTIEDSSINKTGKILASSGGISNFGGTLIINDGTIEVNNTKEFDDTYGVSFFKGSVTINGGNINVTGVSQNNMSNGIYENGPGGTFTMNGGYINVNSPFAKALFLRGTAYINGGTIESNGDYIYGQATIYLGTNEEGIGATFVGGIKSYYTLNSLLKLTEGVGYYDANGNLIEVADDVTEILDKGDITVKRIN